jgi:chemotaxis protein MotB
MMIPARQNKRRAKAAPRNKNLWVITFSDLSTLLMALFVLVFSMSSIDSGLVERIGTNLRGSSATPLAEGGAADSRSEQALELLGDSRNLSRNAEAVKELIFGNVLPPELVGGMLRDKVAIISREDGAAIVFAEDILFESGSAVIPARGRKLLEALIPLLGKTPNSILITGHSDDRVYTEAEAVSRKTAQYQLSGTRALAVLKLYLEANIDKKRLAVAGYGPDRPLFPPSPLGNRRIEVLIKNAENAYSSSR